MSQATAAIANMSRTLYRAAVNAITQAIQSQNSGLTEPTETYAYMWWADTTTGILKQRNAANSGWISILTLSTGDPVSLSGKAASGANNDITSLTALTAGGLPNSSVLTADIADANVTPAKLSQPFASGTVVAGSSQTEVPFTVPSYVKRFTVSLVNFSTNGTARPIIQLGDSGGYETSGYAGNVGYRGAGADALTTCAGLNQSGLLFATAVLNGHVTFTLHEASTNTWVWSGMLSISGPGTEHIFTAGSKSLSAALTGFRITTLGSDTIDSGSSMNVIYD